MKYLLVILTAVAVALPASATVDLTLYNSFPLLDNSATPLYGTTSAGDLVQLILTGPNGIIDTPSGTGGVTGDDVLLFTTHVGAGLPGTSAGLLVQSSILFANSLIGTGAYVRFWDSNTAANSSYYGTSMVFALPSGDAFGLAELDFVPLSGSPRTANIPFSGSGGPAAVPEPSSLFILGLGILCVRWFRQQHRRLRTLALVAGLLAGTTAARAQITTPLDVTASSPILDAAGQPLSGDNPVNGGTTVRCLVQVLSVGANGVADLPNLDGTPGGDDSVLNTTVIGQGISPEIASSGRFSTSFYPPPAAGTKIYARVFDAGDVAGATHYGQSATFTVAGTAVFDLSARGLVAATQPLGSNPTVTDSDGDGQTDYQELVANTNPLVTGDRLGAGNIATPAGQGVQVSVAGRTGRQYVLQRSTDDLGAGMTWSDVAGTATGVLSADQNLVLSDPSPPAGPKAFYRIKVTMP